MNTPDFKVTWWCNVALCDIHWSDINPRRDPVRVMGLDDPCVRCGEPANIIVRAQVNIP